MARLIVRSGSPIRTLSSSVRPPSSSVVREVNWVETGSGLLTRMSDTS